MNDRFLKACRREPVDRTPIWLMRQAGRYMPEYRAIKDKFPSMLDMVKRPDVAAEITLQPVKAFDVDAAIIYADILTLLEGMGLRLEFVKGEGPVIHNPVRTLADVDRLSVKPPRESMPYTLEAIRLVKRELAGKLPVIGFSGAPFTLACYAIEGGASRDFALAKAFMFNEPEAWKRLMEKLAWAAGAYLRAQAEAGADALQLFDSWAGALAPADYENHALPAAKKAVDVARAGSAAPIIYFSTGTTAYPPLLRKTGADVIGVDWRGSLDAIWTRLGEDVAVQGNLDPAALLGPRDALRDRALDVLHRAAGRPGHIFNLGHGILQPTPPDNVRMLVDFVHENSAR